MKWTCRIAIKTNILINSKAVVYPALDSEGNAIIDLTSIRGNFLIVAPEHFTFIDDKHFGITGVYAGTVAYYFDDMRRR